MFSNKKLAKAFEYAVSRKSGDGDVWDGSMMRDIPMSQRLCVLEFSLSSDGTGFFARGNQSWGPITAVCLNLPPALRGKFAVYISKCGCTNIIYFSACSYSA